MNRIMRVTNSKPVIVTAANEDYSYPLAIMLKSLEINLENENTTDVYVLYSTFSPEGRKEISNSLNSEKININWVKINHTRLYDLKIDGHVSIETYYRLLIEDIFIEFDKVIYLDADLVVNQCISKMWKAKFKGRHLLAVPQAAKK